ncbi:H-NS family nucleoid-associated regulatory protein [Burkholderia sp. AW49-1]
MLTASGVDIRALVNRKKLRSHTLGKVETTYRNPETGVTWTGRGRMPRCLIGQDLRKFAVATETGTDMESEQSRLNLGHPSTNQAGSRNFGRLGGFVFHCPRHGTPTSGQWRRRRPPTWTMA